MHISNKFHVRGLPFLFACNNHGSPGNRYCHCYCSGTVQAYRFVETIVTACTAQVHRHNVVVVVVVVVVVLK